MIAIVKINSKKKNEINRFLSKFYNTNLGIENSLKWEKEYQNPVEITEIIGAFVDSFEHFDIQMWISLDKDVFINVSDKNANFIIKYLFERYPY